MPQIHLKPRLPDSFQDVLKRHLIAYKVEQLGIPQPGVFLYRGREVKREHILPKVHRFRNLFAEAEPHVRRLLKDPKIRLRLHMYFHHLNSSQAFTFNLFFPYFYGGPEASSALLRALNQKGMLVDCHPEAIPDEEERSNIDMLWTTDDGTTTICEVKLSETDFGKAADDGRHQTKFKTYEVLSAHLEPGRFERQAFFEAYQFNRNVWHMVRHDNNRLIFLLPRANAGLWKLVDNLRLGVVPHTRERISVIATEDVIEKLSADVNCPEHLRKYADRLGHKYSPSRLR